MEFLIHLKWVNVKNKNKIKNTIGKIRKKKDNDMTADVTQLEYSKNKCYN